MKIGVMASCQAQAYGWVLLQWPGHRFVITYMALSLAFDKSSSNSKVTYIADSSTSVNEWGGFL